jgi:hypothetical protein
MTKPSSEKLSPNVDFYMHVGLCITAWAEIDEKLFEVFHDVMSTPQELSAIVYYQCPILSIGLELVDAVLATILPKRSRKDGGHHHADTRAWMAIKKRIDGLSGTRSRIAHQHTKSGVGLRYAGTDEVVPIPIGQSIPLDQTKFETAFWLSAGQHERLLARHANAKPLKIAELKSHLSEVQEAAKAVAQFRTSKLRALLQERSRQEAKQKRDRDAKNVRLTIGLRPPPRSSQT